MMQMFIHVLFLLLTLLSNIYSQSTFSLQGNFGLGVVKHRFGDAKGGLVGTYGITARYSGYTVGYRDFENSEFTLFSPPHEIHIREFIVGYAFSLIKEPRFIDCLLGLYTGIGSAKEITPRWVANYGFLNDVYEYTSRFSTCVPLELCCELRTKYYIGVSHTVYATYSQFSPLYGYYLSIMVGYW